MNGLIFFLPINTRPNHYPPIKIPGSYWHTGVIYAGKVYECFNYEKYSVSNLEERKPELDRQKARYVPFRVFPSKLDEVKSGTSCENFVLRAIGISRLIGPNKGELYPQDAYNIISSGISRISFPINEYIAVQKRLNNHQTIFSTRMDKDFKTFKKKRYFLTPWDELLYVKSVKIYDNIEAHPFYDELTKEQRDTISEYEKFKVVELIRT